MAAMATASSQRLSRRSRLAISGARSSGLPSTSMPRLTSQAPRRRSRPRPCTRRLGLGAASSTASVRPSCQPLTNWLWCAKPGSVRTCQPKACRAGTCSAWKSPKNSSCGVVHNDAPPSAAGVPRHCSSAGSRATSPRCTRACSASASRCASVATVTCSPRGPSAPRGRRPSSPSPRVRVRRVSWGGGAIATVSQLGAAVQSAGAAGKSTGICVVECR